MRPFTVVGSARRANAKPSFHTLPQLLHEGKLTWVLTLELDSAQRLPLLFKRTTDLHPT